MPEGYRDADGMIYYTDRDAKLYSVDSNGENKKLISDEGSTDIRYSDGKLFYNSADDGSLMCLADNRKYELSEGRAELLTMTSSVFYPELPRTEAGNVYKSDMYGNRTTDNYFIRRQYDTAVPNIGGGVIFGEAVRYTRIFTGSGEGESEKIRYAYRLYSARITEAGTETKKVAEFPATEMCFDVEGHKMYFLNAEEMEKNGDSPIYVYDGETVYELPGGVRAESFGFLYADGKADQDKIGYITKEEVGNGTYHVFDISNGDISEALLVESVIGSNGVIARYPSENETDRPVVIQKGDVLSVSFSGKDKVIENAVYIDMLGDLIYYRDSGEHDSGGVAGIMEAAVATDLWAYNYRTDEIIYISDDYAHRFIVSEYPEEILVYRTGANQYKLVDGETSESVWPNKGLFRYGETAVIECIATSGNDGGYLFKIDKDRNFVKLTDSTVKEWIYVPNGADKAKFSD